MGCILIMGGSIIFAGCSFTWGQGLWSYCPSDLKIPTVDEYIEQGHPVPEEAEHFRIDNRFANLVGNHFDCKSIVKRHNGGTDEESIRFINEVKNNWVTEHSLLTVNVHWDTVKYIVFQTTQAYRSPYTFFYKDEEYEIFSTPNLQNLERVQKVIRHDNAVNYEELESLDLFFDYLIDNNISFDNFQKTFIEFQKNQIKNCLKYYEDTYNIKPLILCWTNEYVPLFLKDSWCRDKMVKLKYNNQDYHSISDLFRVNNKFEILNDKETIHKSGTDGHPSLKCHRLIADCIIEKIYQTQDKNE